MKPINFPESIMGFLTHMQLLEGQGATWTSINSISLSLALECTLLYRPLLGVLQLFGGFAGVSVPASSYTATTHAIHHFWKILAALPLAACNRNFPPRSSSLRAADAVDRRCLTERESR